MEIFLFLDADYAEKYRHEKDKEELDADCADYAEKLATENRSQKSGGRIKD